MVVCTDVDTMYRMMGVRSDYRKSQWYTIARISRVADHILTIIDPELRRERKKYIMPAVRVAFHISRGPSGTLPSDSTTGEMSITSRRVRTGPSPHGSNSSRESIFR